MCYCALDSRSLLSHSPQRSIGIQTYMRILVLCGALSLLLVGCGGNSDKKLAQQICGTWLVGNVGAIAFGPDGKCVSAMKSPTQQWRYEGRWAVKDGALYVRTTLSNSVPVNEAMRLKIIRLSQTELVYQLGEQKMSLRRKK